ncbi:MAG: hypothetical protein ABEJ77_04710 [Halanaeroarchaeum sp.]
MDATIGLAHAPEGGGNATRMLGVAAVLASRDVDVALAGGGPGAKFARLNGFEEAEPETVDFIERRRGSGSLLGALPRTAGAAVERARDFGSWLDRTRPDVLLTDDPFAMLPAVVRGIPFYRLDHSSVDCYDAPFERTVYRVFNRLSIELGEGFLLTSVHDDPHPDTDGVHPVPPIAHEPSTPESVDPFDTLVIPGTYSTGFDRIAAELERGGQDVTLVGDEDWEPVRSMTPYSAAADAVVCTGFSSIAEAVVAGTPVVVYPFIDCQRGIAEAIEVADVEGITVVHSSEEAVAAARDPPPAPSFENGAPAVADHLLSFLADEADRTRQ